MADILIRGMKMPTSCEDCEIESGDEYDLCHICDLIYKGYTDDIRSKGRRDDCPLSEAPEQKHGKWLEQLYYEQFWANYCSECHAYLPQGMDWQPNYCPMCGARMDSET